MSSLLQSSVASLHSFLERQLGPIRTSDGDRRVLTLDDLRSANSEGPRCMVRARSVTDDLVTRGCSPTPRARSRALSGDRANSTRSRAHSGDDFAMWRRNMATSCCSTELFRPCMEDSCSDASSDIWSACDGRVLDNEGTLSLLSRLAAASIELPKQACERCRAAAMGRLQYAQTSAALHARTVFLQAHAVRERHFHTPPALHIRLPELTAEFKTSMHKLSRRGLNFAFTIATRMLGARRCLAALKEARDMCPMTLAKTLIGKLEETAAAQVDSENSTEIEKPAVCIDAGTGGMHADDLSEPVSRQPSVASGDTGSLHSVDVKDVATTPGSAL